jgi:Amt family ammonium transporter
VLIPSPKWLDSGDNAWQMAAATFVALQSVPGLVIFYGGIVKKKWAINSAFMAMYAFAAVMVVWALWGYNMAFGPQWFPFLGTPKSILSAAFEEGRAIILAGAELGRMSFNAWMIFVPLWMTFIYTVGAFSLWGGGWLAVKGVVDFSGGYVIHLSAATSGFVAAAIVGPRLARDRDSFEPNSLLITLCGAGILWLGWNGFNGGDPYFANADAGAAILNTNIASCVCLLVWTFMDYMKYGKPSVIGAVNGLIAGLVGITPAAGYVNGWGAIIIGIVAAVLPWFSMNIFAKTSLMRRVDDTLGVFHTHGVAAVVGGLLTGLLADPNMLVYVGTDKDAPGVAVTGSLHQFILQIQGALFIIVLNIIGTFIILKLISFITPLRMPDAMLRIGDDAVHGEEAYALYGDGSRVPVPESETTTV